MNIHKILNNNVAVILDENQNEKIIMGKGICFQKKIGSQVEEQNVDKIFSLSTTEASNKFQNLVKDLPLEHVELGERIISEAKLQLGKKLNDLIYISLIDHIYSSILRFLDGVTVKNVLLWDIKRFYKDEFEVGLFALKLINETFKVNLPEDEAGFIALHFVNAEMNETESSNIYKITKIMQEITNLVRYFFHVEFNEDNVYYFRFITHLKFFAKRLVEKKTYEAGDNEDIFHVIKAKYEKSYQCVGKIAEFIDKKYDYNLSKDEQLYLTIHIERVIQKILD